MCKNAAGPGVSGTFTFDVGGHTVSVPVGACAQPLEVPAGTITVTEHARPGMVVTDISTFPSGRTVSRDPGSRSITVAVAAGDISTQTVVTFANAFEIGQLKVCKVAGPGVAGGTGFHFTAAGQAFIVTAGAAPGGLCRLAGDFPAGTSVTVTELAAAGTEVSSIAVAPAGRLTGQPDVAARSVSVAMGPGVTEVTFTNRAAQPPVSTTTTTPGPAATTTTVPTVAPTTTSVPGIAPQVTTTTVAAGGPTTTVPGGGPTTTVPGIAPQVTTTTVAPGAPTTVPGGGPTTTTSVPGIAPQVTTTTVASGPPTTVPGGGPTTTVPGIAPQVTTTTVAPGAPTTVPGGGTTTTVPGGGATTTGPGPGGPTAPTTAPPRGHRAVPRPLALTGDSSAALLLLASTAILLGFTLVILSRLRPRRRAAVLAAAPEPVDDFVRTLADPFFLPAPHARALALAGGTPVRSLLPDLRFRSAVTNAWTSLEAPPHQNARSVLT